MNQESASNPVETPAGKEGEATSPLSEKKTRARAKTTRVEEAPAGELQQVTAAETETPAKKRIKAKAPAEEPQAAAKEVAEKTKEKTKSSGKTKTEAKEKPAKPGPEKPKAGKKEPVKAAEEITPAAPAKPPVEKREPDLRERYLKQIAPQMMKEFKYKNMMEVPRLNKIVLNIGLGEATTNAKAIESAQKDLSAISGQLPVITRAKKSISAFKLRAGMPIGVVVTLRGKRLWDFLNKLMNVVLPRIRDFQGVPADSFDRRGNYTLGLKEQLVFPEIEFDKVEKVRGLQITIVSTSRKAEEGKRLLELMGMPFARS